MRGGRVERVEIADGDGIGIGFYGKAKKMWVNISFLFGGREQIMDPLEQAAMMIKVPCELVNPHPARTRS